jgi:hypothetical protein
MSKKVVSLVVSLLVLMVLLLTTVTAFADTVSWSGTLGPGDPTWFRPDCSGITGSEEWYDVQQFTVSADGSYTFTVTALTGAVSPDTYYLLYQNSFDSAQPSVNCIAEDDDGNGAAITYASQMTVNLVAGVPYTLVTTQCCDGVTPEEAADYTNEITGPGVITLGALVTANCPNPLPANSVVYQVPAGAPAFYAADLSTKVNFDLPAGSWKISEFSGDFAKVWISCGASSIWIPSNAVGGVVG